jgi:hypothetical protein
MKILLLIILMGLNSCASINRWIYGDSNLKDFSKNICLNGQGTGKIAAGDDSYSFDFQSALKKNKWLLGVQFLLRGEEVLIANFKDQDYYISGDFFENVKTKLIKSSPWEIEHFNIFSKELAFFIEELKNIKKDPNFYEKCEKKSGKYHCKYLLKNRAKRVTIWHQDGSDVAYSRSIGKDLILKASFKYPSRQGFREISIRLYQVVRNRHQSRYSLQLFNKNCM